MMIGINLMTVITKMIIMKVMMIMMIGTKLMTVMIKMIMMKVMMIMMIGTNIMTVMNKMIMMTVMMIMMTSQKKHFATITVINSYKAVHIIIIVMIIIIIVIINLPFRNNSKFASLSTEFKSP